MLSEECLDPSSAGHAEAINTDPPAPTTRHPKREISQGLDAGPPQGGGDPRLKPQIDAIANQWDWHGSDAQLLEGGSHGACGRRSLASGTNEELGEIVAVTRSGKRRHIAADRPDDAASGLAVSQPFAQVALDCAAGRHALMPGPQG
jgi:hypothetical protein